MQKVISVPLLATAAAVGIGSAAAVPTAEPATLLACSSGTYQNVDGLCISDEQAPTGSGAPSGATAVCKDGSYSFSTHHTGTCSGHHGVSQWLSS